MGTLTCHSIAVTMARVLHQLQHVGTGKTMTTAKGTTRESPTGRGGHRRHPRILRVDRVLHTFHSEDVFPESVSLTEEINSLLIIRGSSISKIAAKDFTLEDAVYD
jgi:hypothetical protein